VVQCAKHKIYTILDLHAVPGTQNPDWHSDNVTNHAAFWDHKDHQDRVVWLWREIARRYRDNPWVAGYNPINEPCDPLHYRLPAFLRTRREGHSGDRPRPHPLVGWQYVCDGVEVFRSDPAELCLCFA